MGVESFRWFEGVEQRAAKDFRRVGATRLGRSSSGAASSMWLELPATSFCHSGIYDMYGAKAPINRDYIHFAANTIRASSDCDTVLARVSGRSLLRSLPLQKSLHEGAATERPTERTCISRPA